MARSIRGGPVLGGAELRVAVVLGGGLLAVCFGGLSFGDPAQPVVGGGLGEGLALGLSGGVALGTHGGDVVVQLGANAGQAGSQCRDRAVLGGGIETFDLARTRLVEPAQLDDTGYAQLLPATANARWKADHD